MDNLPIIDWDAAISLAGDQRDLAEDILKLMMRDLKDNFNAIKHLYKTHNYDELLQQVHKLHGALCYCGLPRLKSLTACLETDIKNHIMDGLPSLFMQFEKEINLLLEHYSLYIKEQ